MDRLKWVAVLTALVAISFSWVTSVTAETYPSRTIKVVVPYSAGSGADVVARLVTPKLSTILKQNIIVENRPGTSAIVGTESVARADPDGYTLLEGVTQHAINPGLIKNLPYDTTAAFAPISRLTSQPLILAINSSLPVNSVSELIAYVKQHPGKFNYASTGIGTSIHLAGAYFAYKAGLEMSHVAYTSASQAVVDLGRGDVQMIFYTYSLVLPEVQLGRARILATTSAERSSWLPNVPTMIESGFPEFAMPAWQGIFSPAKTPLPVIEVLEKGLAEVMAEPEVKENLEATGTDVYYASSEKFGKFVQSEIERYGEVIAVTNTKPE
jgi:tripartite-type tricarboxylate transporter receptor subunit TctC